MLIAQNVIFGEIAQLLKTEPIKELSRKINDLRRSETLTWPGVCMMSNQYCFSPAKQSFRAEKSKKL